MTEWKQVLVIRKDLNMRKGKIAAQAAHASLDAVLEMDSRSPTLCMWLDTGARKICVSVNSEEELVALYEHAKSEFIATSLVTDLGHTEFHGVPTKTAVAIGPATSSKVDKITGHLPLL